LTHLLSAVVVAVAPMVAAEAAAALINQSLDIPLLLVMQSTPALALEVTVHHGPQLVMRPLAAIRLLLKMPR
jgi:hypothetical protein